MQTVYLSQALASIIHCPFCGQEVMDEDKVPEITPCMHTLFIGTDEGFEYWSDRFEQTCTDTLEGGFQEFDVHTPMKFLEIPDAVCFVLEPVPPSMLCAYIGFMADNLPFDSDEGN